MKFRSEEEFEQAYARVRMGGEYTELPGGVGVFRSPLLDGTNLVKHGFSSKNGGISTGFLSTLNLSFTREFEPREVTMENYRILCKAAGIDDGTMVMDAYEHGTTVRRVTRKDCGAGYTAQPLEACDGLITDDPEVTLVTGHADCMAFYAVDPEHRAIGLAHAGWRGALDGMGRFLIAAMRDAFGTDPAGLIMAVGPSICPDCFEVGEDVRDLFVRAYPYGNGARAGKPGKAYVDLWRVAACQFMEAGARPENIQIMGICTVEDDRLYSYRGDLHNTGGMAAYLKLL